MRVSISRHCDRQLYRLPALLGLLLAFCLFDSSAYAQCISPPGNEGTKEWFAGSGGGSPTGCGTIGQTCSDGSKYAGISPDGSVPMYATPADAGTYGWASSDSVTGATSTTNGDGNTAILEGVPAAVAAAQCAALSAHGHDDWYLPAQNELDILYTNRAAIGGFTTNYYWSSTETASGTAMRKYFSSGFSMARIKNDPNYVRCVRQDAGGTPASTPGYKFCIDGNWVDLTEDGTLGACTTEADWDYDAAEKTFKQCDGTDWKKITCADGGGPSGGNCDPSEEDTFTQVANWPQSRYDTSAAMLSDGRVLICGGYNGSNRCDLYDPDTNIWTQVANLPQSKFNYATAALNDGRALVCGGTVSSSATNRCDVYNPVTNSWTQVANLPQSKTLPTAATLGDGRILICGGMLGGTTTVLNRCDIYNPPTNSFTQVANLPAQRYFTAASSLADGRVLLCGGFTASGSGATNRCDIYDAGANSWTQVANLPEAKSVSAAILLSDGKVLICGGNPDAFTTSNRCDIYDVSTNNWTQVANLPEARQRFPGAPLPDGRALICGGMKSNFSATNRCDIYNYNCVGVGGGGSCISLGSCSVEGRMEYDTVNDVMMYCDGTD